MDDMSSLVVAGRYVKDFLTIEHTYGLHQHADVILAGKLAAGGKWSHIIHPIKTRFVHLVSVFLPNYVLYIFNCLICCKNSSNILFNIAGCVFVYEVQLGCCHQWSKQTLYSYNYYR